jgi:hypothetical protein
VPPVIASVLSPASRNGPSTVIWPFLSDVVHMHSQEVPGTVRTHWPPSLPTTVVSEAS